MYDSQYDKTAREGRLGPHVLELQSSHLAGIIEKSPLDHERVRALKKRVYDEYEVRALTEEAVRERLEIFARQLDLAIYRI
jgi:hypothetical protein